LSSPRNGLCLIQRRLTIERFRPHPTSRNGSSQVNPNPEIAAAYKALHEAIARGAAR